MRLKVFPVIDPTATGNNIRRLRLERGLTVRDVQDYFGFEEPRAIYKWQRGETLPSVDNLYALGNLFEVPMEQILVPTMVKLHSLSSRLSPAAQIILCVYVFASNARSRIFLCIQAWAVLLITPLLYKVSL